MNTKRNQPKAQITNNTKHMKVNDLTIVTVIKGKDMKDNLGGASVGIGISKAGVFGNRKH